MRNTTLRGLPLWLHGMAGYALIAIATTALVFGLMVLAQVEASSRASKIASHKWTKVSTRPGPFNRDSQIVHLRTDDPGVSGRDQEIAVEDDDPLSQDILAVPDGESISFQLVQSKAYGSRTLAYNYLQPKVSGSSGQTDFRRQ